MKGRWHLRVPLFKEQPTLRPPRQAIRRVLVILAPTDADVRLELREPPVDSRVHVPTFPIHSWRAPMRCEEIMKRTVECVTAKDSVQVAARKMRDENVGFLPVCENGSKVIGTITDRDIAIRACADDKPASKTKIADVMTREVVSCKPSDDISRAEELMGKHHKSRMICIDDGGKLAGVISLSDIAQHQADAGAQTLREVTTREAQVH